MGLIQDLIRKWREKKEEKKTYERQQRVVERYEEKKMSNDERELLKWKEQQRQKQISAELKAIRKAENDKLWGGHLNNPVDAPNIMKDTPNIFKQRGRIF